MKKIPYFFLFVIVLFSFSNQTYEAKNSTAEVEQLQGFYLFVDSRPVKEYEFLGSIKGGGGAFNPQYTVIRDNLLKKARKEYPKGNGIILQLNSGGADRADIIRFKE